MIITDFISAPKKDVFKAFVDPKQLEKWWSYPSGMTLRIPQFEARTGGRYQYVHKADEGNLNCIGHFVEFIPNERLTFVDEKITDPNGEVLFENIKGAVTFMDKGSGTEIIVTEEGFRSDEEEQMFEEGWKDSLENLKELLSSSFNDRRYNKGDPLAEMY